MTDFPGADREAPLFRSNILERSPGKIPTGAERAEEAEVNSGKNQIKAICLVFWLAALLFVALSGLLGWNLAQIGREDLTSVGGRVVTVQRAGDLYRLELEEFPGRAFTLSDYCCQADLTEALAAGEEVVLEVSRAQLEGGAALDKAQGRFLAQLQMA